MFVGILFRIEFQAQAAALFSDAREDAEVVNDGIKLGVEEIDVAGHHFDLNPVVGEFLELR